MLYLGSRTQRLLYEVLEEQAGEGSGIFLLSVVMKYRRDSFSI